MIQDQNKHVFHHIHVLITFDVSEKPVIQIRQLEYTALVGDSVSIIALVTGTPAPKVNWTFNSEGLFYKKTDVIIETSGDNYKMNITKAAVSQAGTYTITAVNDAGQDQKYVTLNVYCEYCYL